MGEEGTEIKAREKETSACKFVMQKTEGKMWNWIATVAQGNLATIAEELVTVLGRGNTYVMAFLWAAGFQRMQNNKNNLINTLCQPVIAKRW